MKTFALILMCLLSTKALSQGTECLNIAHRGASSYLPEHTLQSYALAIQLGADAIEPDLVPTKDRVLVSLHDNLLNLTTNVADLAEFKSRKTTKTIDGRKLDGWFSEDFTLEEIKKLRIKERLPDVRLHAKYYDGSFQIPTFKEILSLRKEFSKKQGRIITVAPEIKHSTYFRSLNINMEDLLLKELKRNKLTEFNSPVMIQSFEISNLKYLKSRTNVRLIQLLWKSHGPFDVLSKGGRLSYDYMATKKGLKEIASYAYAVAPEKYHFIVGKTEEGSLSEELTSSFVEDAHSVGLKVYPFTFRQENQFLPKNLQTSKDKSAYGDLLGEIQVFLKAGIDGLFTDNPDIARIACLETKN